MPGIEINNAVANAGGLPAIFAGPSAPTLPAYSLWLETTSNTMHYYNGSAWVAIGSLPAIPILEEVLEAGNIATTDAVWKSISNGTNVTVSGNNISLDYSGNTFLRLIAPTNFTPGIINFAGSGSTCNILCSPKPATMNIEAQNGWIYAQEAGKATLSAGSVTINPLGTLTATSVVIVSCATASGTLGVTYASTVNTGSNTVGIRSLKTNATIETSDNSSVFYTIIYA
jgi:hypothetical protein